MKINYTADKIDIIGIECTKNEINKVCNELKENYPCVPKVTINITDINKILFIYYFGFNGKRFLSNQDLSNIDDINYLVCSKGSNSFNSILNKLKKCVKYYIL